MEYSYISLKKNKFTDGDYCLVPLREKDIFLIKEWRNKQVNILRQEEVLTDEDQRNYYDNIIIPAFSQIKPTQVLFSFLHLDACIGYGGLVHISWMNSRAEISFLLNPELTINTDIYGDYFNMFLILIKRIAFLELNLNRIYTETFDIRPEHIAVLEKSGFVFEGRMKKHSRINGEFVDSLIHGLLGERYEY